MTPEEVERAFSRDDGSYVFARWGRAIAPVVFGVDDATLAVIKGAFEALAQMAGREIAETDPELGSNCMVFFLRDWSELNAVPDLDRLVPGLADLVVRLTAGGANQYRALRFDEAGAIRAAFVFLRMDDAMAAVPAPELALAQVAQVMLAWSNRAFTTRSPLAVAGETTILHPDVGDLIRAAYDPVLPDAASDRTHALRLFARMTTDRERAASTPPGGPPLTSTEA